MSINRMLSPCLLTIFFFLRSSSPQGGVEGRLPTDIASVLMPLLAASDTKGPKPGLLDINTFARLLKQSVSRLREEKDGGDGGSIFEGRYISLEARAVVPIYRTQLFTKVRWGIVSWMGWVCLDRLCLLTFMYTFPLPRPGPHPPARLGAPRLLLRLPARVRQRGPALRPHRAPPPRVRMCEGRTRYASQSSSCLP